MQRKIWRIRETHQEVSKQIAESLEISLLLAQLLTSRGIEDVEAARQFLYADLGDLHPPFLIDGMDRAVERVQHAIEHGEKICIYGDYDVDGMTSVSLLLGGFKELGLESDYYIPDRMEEGYGINKEAIDDIHARGVTLMITVDCGVTSVAEIEHANKLGIDVIVTDHHEPDSDHLPPAYTILNPKLSDKYPFDGLAGVGIAFKLLHALAGGKELPPYLHQQLDLVALGTVVDVTPLVDENRILTRFGLQVLNRRERIGIKALCEVARISDDKSITTYQLGYVLGPRLNAAGRLDTAKKAVELLTTDSMEEARTLAEELDLENKARKEIEQRIVEQAEAKIKQEVDLVQAKSLVLAEENWHRGVIGIVASRIVERYHRPTILIALEGKEGHGSGRSIEAFNLYEGLVACQGCLERFGGHKAAAGLSILKQNIPKLRYQLAKVASERLTEEDLTPKIHIDLLVGLDQLSEKAIQEIALMEPFGLGNPKPVLGMKAATLRWPARIMAQKHLQLWITDGNRSLRAVGWNMSNYQILLQETSTPVDLAFYLEVNEYKGERRVQLNLRDIQIQTRDRRSTIRFPVEATGPAQLIDQRGVPDKIQYVRHLVRQGEPMIIYVKSDAALEHLRQQVSDMPIEYCGVRHPPEKRQQLIDQFTQSQTKTIVSSITLPEVTGVRHIVFCHPVPSERMFMRRCKPAFHTESLTAIHLIFHSRDIKAMYSSLAAQYPPRDVLTKLYRSLRVLAQQNGHLLSMASIQKQTSLPEHTIQQGLDILEELELLAVDRSADPSTARMLPPPAQRKDLKASQRFAEGETIRQDASRFGELLLNKSIEELWGLLHHAET